MPFLGPDLFFAKESLSIFGFLKTFKKLFFSLRAVVHSPASTLEHCIIPCVQKAFVLDTDVTWEGSTQVCVLEACERENFGQKTRAVHHEGYGPPVLGHSEELKPARKEMITYWFGMSGYTFFCWPGEILHLPGPAIKVFRDCFSLTTTRACGHRGNA